MEDEYTYAKAPKNGGKKGANAKKSLQKNGNSIKWQKPNNSLWTDEDEDRILFYEWLYDEGLEEYVVNEKATDEFGLKCGEIMCINTNKAWELPKQIEELSKSSILEFQSKPEGKFEGDLVFFRIDTNLNFPSYSRPNQHGITDAKNLVPEYDDEEEEEVEYEIIQNRKGRSVKPVKKQEKKSRKRCEYIETLKPGTRYTGPIRIYILKTKDKLSSKDFAFSAVTSCTCPRCVRYDYRAIECRKHKKKFLQENEDFTLDQK